LKVEVDDVEEEVEEEVDADEEAEAEAEEEVILLVEEETLLVVFVEEVEEIEEVEEVEEERLEGLAAAVGDGVDELTFDDDEEVVGLTLELEDLVLGVPIITVPYQFISKRKPSGIGISKVLTLLNPVA